MRPAVILNIRPSLSCKLPIDDMTYAVVGQRYVGVCQITLWKYGGSQYLLYNISLSSSFIFFIDSSVCFKPLVRMMLSFPRVFGLARLLPDRDFHYLVAVYSCDMVTPLSSLFLDSVNYWFNFTHLTYVYVPYTISLCFMQVFTIYLTTNISVVSISCLNVLRVSAPYVIIGRITPLRRYSYLCLRWLVFICFI